MCGGGGLRVVVESGGRSGNGFADRIVKRARFDTVTQETPFAGPVTGVARAKGTIIHFFGTLIKLFNGDSPSGRLAISTGTAGVVAGVVFGKCAYIGAVIMNRVVIEARRGGCIANVAEEDRGRGAGTVGG